MKAPRFGIAMVATLALLMLGGCSAASTEHGTLTYGKLPAFLPKQSIVPDSELTGTVAHPALTTEGDRVKLSLPTGSVTATISGPEVPGEGLPYQTTATTCTWTVTLTGATTSVPITVSDFSSIDHLGAVYHPQPVPGQPAIPAAIAPGQTVSFELRAVMEVGEGLMRWAPGNRGTIASWDFEVEND